MTPWLAAATSGILLLLSFPPFGLGWLAWVALAPLLLATRGAVDVREAANFGAVAGLIFYVPALHWMFHLFGPLAAGFWCIFALWIALHQAVLRALWTHWRHQGWRGELAWVAAAGVLWTGIEYFRSEVWWMPCAWLTLGSSQVTVPAALQGCALVGVYGLSGFLAAVAAAAGLAVTGRRAALGAGAIPAIALLAWGGMRLATPPVGRALSVAAVQDESMSLDRLARATADAARAGARLVVWPEYAYRVLPGHAAQSLALVRGRLAGVPATVVVGAALIPDEVDPRKLKKGDVENFAWVFGPRGRLLGRYDKLHPIPAMENFLRPNPDPQPVDSPAGRLGVQICYDLDFENGPRRLAAAGAELLVVPNLDPAEWGAWQHRQHSGLAPLRAVETGLPVVRAASSGWSQLIDARGRVTATLAPDRTGVLAGAVLAAAASTPYMRWGWRLAPGCLVVSLLLLSQLAFWYLRSVPPSRRRRR